MLSYSQRVSTSPPSFPALQLRVGKARAIECNWGQSGLCGAGNDAFPCGEPHRFHTLSNCASNSTLTPLFASLYVGLAAESLLIADPVVSEDCPASRSVGPKACASGLPAAVNNNVFHRASQPPVLRLASNDHRHVSTLGGRRQHLTCKATCGLN